MKDRDLHPHGREKEKELLKAERKNTRILARAIENENFEKRKRKTFVWARLRESQNVTVACPLSDGPENHFHRPF